MKKTLGTVHVKIADKKKTARKRAFTGILNECKLKKGMNFVYITINWYLCICILPIPLEQTIKF